MAHYDRIGTGYARTRQADPRIAAHIREALGDARTVVNVGAGTGSYEPADRAVVAVEPSREMVRQRPAGAAPAVQAVAEYLPFPDSSFEAAMAVLTVHHWSDPVRGLRELRRVARQRVVVLTWDQATWESFWLHGYFPAFIELDRRRAVPLEAFAAVLGGVEVRPVPIPHDCGDGFAGAFWRRPAAYLDPAVRAGVSLFRLAPERAVAAGLRRLAADLRSGAWAARFGPLQELEALDLGYRLVIGAP
ncbi:MAG TPA: methyltransferase domain-containing protein [Dehalococcoidia bacterium]